MEGTSGQAMEDTSSQGGKENASWSSRDGGYDRLTEGRVMGGWSSTPVFAE